MEIYPQFVVGEYISTRTYYFETEKSRAYISNELSHTDILLECESADLWTVIVKTQDYKKILEYAKNRNLDNELSDFLDDLKKIGLIKNLPFEQSIRNILSNSININDNEYKTFQYEKNNWLEKNNLLGELFFELTFRCNLKCIHCFNKKNLIKQEILTFHDVKKAIDEAYELGIHTIGVSGGESTLHPDMLEILKYAKSKKLAIKILSNGQTFYDNRQFLNEILKLYPYSISFSLYSMNPEIHDKITGVAGSHKKTKKVIEYLRSKNIKTCIKCFIMDINANEHKEIADFAKKIGASFVIDAHFLTSENNNDYVQLNDKQLQTLLGDKDSLYYISNYKPIEINHDFLNTKICKATKNSLTIDPMGDVYACPSLPIKLGNIRKNRIKDIIRSEKVNKIRNAKKKDMKECWTHDYCRFCVYCPGMAINENGWLTKSEVCCKIAKAKLHIYNQINENINS